MKLKFAEINKNNFKVILISYLKFQVFEKKVNKFENKKMELTELQ